MRRQVGADINWAAVKPAGTGGKTVNAPSGQHQFGGTAGVAAPSLYRRARSLAGRVYRGAKRRLLTGAAPVPAPAAAAAQPARPARHYADFSRWPDTPGQQVFFHKPALDGALQRDGYVIFPLFDGDDMDALAEAVRSAEGTHDHADVHIATDFRLSAFNNDGAYKERLFDYAWAAVREKVEAALPGYEPLVVNLFDKQPGGGYDAVPIHQNPSFVEEPAHKSVSLWIPLDDTDRDNGSLGVLPGSHDRFNTMRAGNMEHEAIFEPVQSLLENELFVPMTLKRGEVLALNDSILHWSYPNVSDRKRTAVQFIMVPVGVPHIYYYFDADAPDHPVMDLYAVDRHFFFGFNCKARPETLPHIGQLPYHYRQITRDDLLPAGAGQ